MGTNSQEVTTQDNTQNVSQLPPVVPPWSPFRDFQIADTTPLNLLINRNRCATCGKTTKYFCYFCYTIVPAARAHTPTVHLPIPVDIIKHEHECDGKSTAIYARLMDP